jgi:hypothetical protein
MVLPLHWTLVLGDTSTTSSKCGRHECAERVTSALLILSEGNGFMCMRNTVERISLQVDTHACLVFTLNTIIRGKRSKNLALLCPSPCLPLLAAILLDYCIPMVAGRMT